MKREWLVSSKLLTGPIAASNLSTLTGWSLRSFKHFGKIGRISNGNQIVYSEGISTVNEPWCHVDSFSESGKAIKTKYMSIDDVFESGIPLMVVRLNQLRLDNELTKSNDEIKKLAIINVYCPRADPDRPERQEYQLKFYKLLEMRSINLIKAGISVIILGDLAIT